MKIVQRPRQGGKTTELLRLLNADPEAAMVVSYESEAVRIRRMLAVDSTRAIPEFPHVSPGRILSAQAVRQGAGRRHVRALYVDNLDAVLLGLLGLPVTAASLDSVDLDSGAE